MSYRRQQQRRGEHDVERELDHLLAMGIQEQVGSEEPPSHVWHGIEQKLKAGPAPAPKRARRRTWRAAPLAQALAVAGVLFVFGLSLGPVLQWPSYMYGQQEPTAELMIYEPEVPLSTYDTPVTADEGLLSRHDVVHEEQAQTYERLVIARDTAPDADPILQHQRDWPVDD